MKKLLQITLLFFGVASVTAQTQGTIDTSFLPNNDGRKGANGAIFQAVEQADGKILIGGQFSAYNSIEKNRLVRMNADGSMDESFNQVNLTSTGNAAVTALAIQPDGKILVGGGFQVINFDNNNELLASAIMRLNPDGTRDTSFLQNNASFSCSNQIYSINVQQDGKIILAGDITNCFGDTLDDNENILRLNTDGTIDPSFAAEIDETGLPGTAEIYKTIIQPDGKILVAGYFNESNGVSSPYLTRLNADGSNDNSFNIGTGFDDDVEDIALQPNGKILVVGQFDDFNGSGLKKIVRLNADGSLDTSFNVGAGPQNTFSPGSFSSADALGVSIQSDGKIIVSGGFNAFDNIQVPQVARLNADGSLDMTFNNSLEGNPLFLSILTPTILNDTGILLTGAFDRLGNYKRDNILKLDSSGNLDFSFNQNYGPSNGGDAVIINDIESTVNGYIVVGQFNEYDNALHRNIAKINNDGSVDTSFSTGSTDTNGFDDEAFDVAVQNDGKIVVAGDFDNYDGNPSGKIARLNADGSFDNTFNTGSGFNTLPNDLKVQPNGKILVAGVFNNYNGTSVDRVVRLNSDGTLDTSFSATISFVPNFIEVMSDGKIFVGGSSTSLIRLNADGSLDSTFNYTDSTLATFAFVRETSSNQYFVGGLVDQPLTPLIRVNQDGSIDNTFTPDPIISNTFLNSNGILNNIVIQSDGKIIVGGDFLQIGTREIRGLARLNTDGTLDSSFNPDDDINSPEGLDIDAGFPGEVFAMSLDNAGRLIVGGFFRSYNKAFKNPLIAVEAFNDVQNFINIPDPNFEQALIDESIDSDGIINGQIAENDALGVINLDVNSKNISDLTGIEAFTDLETLFAVNNNLNAVDLSFNTALDGLVLANNNLTSIDLSNNVNLVSISLASNQLSTIDLSNNTALSQVFVQDNVLTEFDALNLQNLAQLNVSQNDLVELDLSQNSNLNQILANNNNLVNLNLQNGNNNNISGTSFDATSNSNLTCIQVDDVNYSQNTWNLIDTQSFFGLDCAPDNDDCLNATPIVLGQDTPSTTISSTSGNNTPGCQSNGIVIIDVWFQFTAPNSGSITLSLNASPLTLKSALYDNCATQTAIACGEDGLQVDNLTTGNTYYIQTWVEASVSGFMAQNNLTEVGDFTIKVDDTSTLSSIEFNTIDFKLYPNPTYNLVYLSSSQMLDYYSIFNINGKRIKTETDLNSKEYKVNVSDLSEGIYLIKIKSQQSLITKKLIIK